MTLTGLYGLSLPAGRTGTGRIPPIRESDILPKYYYIVIFGRRAHLVRNIGQQDRSRWFGSMLSTMRVQILNVSQSWNFIIDVVVRTYAGKGSKELFSLLEEHKADIEERLRSTKGFVSYTLARSSESDGGLSMTVCQDKAGIDESVSTAKEWIAKNAAHISVDAPKVSMGKIIIHATK